MSPLCPKAELHETCRRSTVIYQFIPHQLIGESASPVQDREEFEDNQYSSLPLSPQLLLNSSKPTHFSRQDFPGVLLLRFLDSDLSFPRWFRALDL
jgi:hypothetical protein